MIGDDRVDSTAFYEWKAAARSFLHLVYGDKHPHSVLFEKEVSYSGYSDALQGVGIMSAALEELKEGFVGRLQDLVAAEVFTDFLRMAQHLLEAGYKDAAASLGGAVLEDGLRRICHAHSVNVRDRDDIGSLNSRLADAQVYSRLVQKRVQVWNDVRNQADHGKFGAYTAADVKDLLDGVSRFLEEHL